MKPLRLGVVAAVALLLTACPGEQPAPPAFEEPTTPPLVDEPMAPAMGHSAELQEVAGSGVTGQVVATPEQDRTQVALSVRGAPVNESVGARIMSGTCESPGVEVARLDAISTDATGTGQSVTNVGYSPHQVMDGNHIAAVFAPGTEPGRDAPIACATIPGMQM
jgi:hypothetical protein